MSAPPFSSVLVANRGEIARRILMSVRALGYRGIAVYSEADADAPYLQDADRAVPIGPAAAAESYLSIERLLEAARRSGAEAIHPGYGFLAENAAFARACRDAGLVFIGPPADAIAIMGDKTKARDRMAAAGVPCVPGVEIGDGTGAGDPDLLARLEAIGYPLMIKAAAGGGGRGMRRVDRPETLSEALQSARSEAANAFGDNRVYIEKAIDPARHVEVQIMADRHGNCIHLGERDCSVQRRHQKVIEEAPSPAVDAAIRAELGRAAVKAAQDVGYEGAGTVEFIMGADGAFYFIEMNTRLQVEHPVTEMITGLDLVEMQLRVAAGEPLPLGQDEVTSRGHAIEARLCTEDAAQGFLPQTGRIEVWQTADLPGVRTDAALANGQRIGAHYDSMVAKVVAHGRDREEARRRLADALGDTVLLGVTTNKTLLRRILMHPTFAAGQATTGFLDKLEPEASPTEPNRLLALAALLACWPEEMTLAVWRRAGAGRWRVAFEDHEPLWLSRDREGNARVRIGEQEVTLDPRAFDGAQLHCLVDGVLERARVARDKSTIYLDALDSVAAFRIVDSAARERADGAGDRRLVAPMDGKLLKVAVAEGERVTKGQVAFVIEAMKMEMQVRAEIDGTVAKVEASAGQQVSARQLLAEIEPDGEEAVEATAPAEGQA